MITQLQSGQASVEQNTVAPFVLKTDYDYSSFGSETLQQQAKDTLSQFLGFVRHTFVSGLEIGRNFRQLLHQLCLEHGFAQGERLFDRWLDSSDFGGSSWMARSLIQISEWFDSQRQRIQNLILNSVQSWSISALKELTKISDDHLLVKLLKAGKQTVVSIRTARKYITLGQSATIADWELVAKTFDANDDAITTLKTEAERLAHVNANPEVLTDYLVETIRDLTEWDVSKLLAPQKRGGSRQKGGDTAISSFIANSALPTDAIDDERLSWIERGLGLDETASQEFRACVENLAQVDAGKDGEALPQHRHIQKALQVQKLAPVAPQQSGKRSYAEGNRITELEKQVRDLTAQLKEADKAAALIRGLQAERDRLERENLKLQQLLQDNAEKDQQIQDLQQQIANLESTQSEAVIEQLQQQNEQLLGQLEQTRQRYEALASEMAAKERSMKYSDNSTLVAKVVALEAQLAEADNKQQKPVDPSQLTVGTYIRVVKHDNQQYRDCIAQIVKLPAPDDTLDRYQVRFSGEKYVVTCYPEQMQLADVFLPPADNYFTAEQVQETIARVAEEKQSQIEELQRSLQQATEAIPFGIASLHARYKDPSNNPELVRWQQRVEQTNARLYDVNQQLQQTTEQLKQLKRENQQLKEELGWKSSPLGKMQPQ